MALTGSSAGGDAVEQYCRAGSAEDPWISAGNHPEHIVYGENGNVDHATDDALNFGGANVWINSRPELEVSGRRQLQGIEESADASVIGWFAFSAGLGVFGGRAYEAIRTTMPDDNGGILNFTESFSSAPGVFGSIMSYDDRDPVALRQSSAADTTGTTLVVQEDRCGDAETTHGPELVAVLMIARTHLPRTHLLPEYIDAARGKTATASSEGGYAARAVDGNIDGSLVHTVG